jgi:trimeric autotransporter adhesin
MRNCYMPSFVKKNLLFVLLLLLGLSKLNAQLDITIGTGTVGNTGTSYPAPLQDWYEGSRAQYLYRASELTAAGMGPGSISSLKFNVTNLNTFSGDIQEMQIKIGGTSSATLTNTWEAVTPIFGPVNYVPTLGINTFTFTTPFFWNGTDNIVVEVCNGLPANVSDGLIHYTNSVTVPWTTGLAFNGSHTYRLDNAGNLCSAADIADNGLGAQTTRPNIIFNWTSATACAGTPTAGTSTSTSTNILCAGTPFTLGLTGNTLASGLTYQWQSATALAGPYTPISGANTLGYTLVQTLPTVYYRCLVTCTTGGGNSTSVPILVTSAGGPIYAQLPYFESFEATWLNGCGIKEIPSLYWKNTPITGNTSWRRNDDAPTTNSGAWTSPTLGLYSPPGSDLISSARFHTYAATSGTSGTLDLYVNCNTSTTFKRLAFDFINATGADSIQVSISENGGTTFTRLDTTGVSPFWLTKEIFFSSLSPTVVLRFRATSDFGTTDIGIDNVRVNNWSNCTGTPVGGTASANPISGACANVPITLSIAGATDGNAITYQWQSAPTATGPWMNIPQATNFTTSVTQVASTSYRCLVTCTSSGLFSYSTVVTVVSPNLPGGTYTINNSLPTAWSGASGNFNSFNDAYNAIKCGISSAVVFNVQQGLTGTYNEQLIIDAPVPNATSTRTVTFNGNGKTLAFASANAAQRAVLKLKGTRFIIFDSLTIDASAGTYGWGVQLTANADSNIIRRCTINTSTTSTVAANYAGIVISGSETDPIGTGTTTALCDANTIDRNTINGGYYGITLTATFAGGANGNNIITNNRIRDFYFYGIYVNGSYATNISGNSISRPSRTSVGEFHGIYLTTQSNTANITKNRIFNPFGGANSSTSAFYGIDLNNASASATNENNVTNNLIYGVNGSGLAYGINNVGTGFIYFLHNTISLDSAGATTSSATRGYSQTGTANAVFFYNNLISITRGGTGTKHCTYNTTPFTFADNNNYYINAAAGSNFIGFLTTNRATLFDWKLASQPFGDDQAAISSVPVFTDPSYAVADYRPNNAAIDNKGLYIGVADDIINVVRSLTTPDIGAFEFFAGGCTLPLVTGTTVINPLSLCQNTPLVLGLNIGAYGSNQTFQWQTSTSATGPWTLIGTPMPVPDTTILNPSATLFYQCVIKCGVSSAVSNPIQVTVSAALPSGTYTINSAGTNTYVPGVPGGNFQTFADAKAAMNCGVFGTGNIIFNVLPGLTGTYNEQLILDSIAGVNVNRQIVFNGNGNTIAFSSGNSNERAVIKLRRADFINFDSLKIDATGPNGFGYGVQLINNADSNSFRRCTITADVTTASTNYAGIVINSTEAGSTTVGNTFCDGNIFDKNTIIGGYYGITSVGGTALSNYIFYNQFTNNRIQDFYIYGLYSAGTFGSVIRGNTISRPTRAVVAAGYGIFLTASPSVRCTIDKNRITRMFGGVSTSTAGAYGIYSNNVDATAGNEVTVTNNAIYGLDGAGVTYGIYNLGSDNHFYYHNTISLDNVNIPSIGTTVGFYQSTDATGVQFLNNIVTIGRTTTGLKQCIYLGSTTTDVTANYNDYLITGGTTAINFIGFRAGTNYATLGAWQAATTKDLNTLNLNPLYTDTANANYRPQMLPLNNMGTALNITQDIVNVNRNLFLPDMGAWEFSPIACVTPPVAGVASVTPNSGICLESPIRLTLTGHSPLGSLTFQWQASSSATGPWVNFGPLSYSPTFDSLSSTTNFYRCLVTCNGNTTTSNVVSITLNAILLAGTYTIDANSPQTWPGLGVGSNFQTFQSAVDAIKCGITGSVLFNVKPGLAANAGKYPEQIRIPYIPGTSATRTVTFQANNGVPSSAELTFASTNAAANYTLRLDSCRFFTFRNMTISATDLTNGRAVEFAGTSSNDSLSRCVINSPTTTSIANTMAAVYANGFRGTNIFIKGNTVNNGSTGIFFNGTSAAVLTQDQLIDSNTVNNAYLQGIYAGFMQRANVRKNTVNIGATSATSVYGIYASDCDSAYNFTSNKVNISNNANTAYGMFLTLSDGSPINPGKLAGNDVTAVTGNTGTLYGLWVNNSPNVDIVNNVIAINTTGANSYGLYHNNSNNTNYYNNTVNSTATSATTNVAAYFLNTSAANLVAKNNIFSHKGGGRAMFVTNPALLTSDYNMLYTSGATLVQRGTPAVNYPSLLAWTSATNDDLFSIGYNPAFVSNADLRPDVTSPDVWAIHGRGVQIATNTFDHENVARPTTLTTGVPDLGAYEFNPPAVLPTVLTATPAVPAANTEQTFSYGTDTVMRIKWGAVFPPSVEVRRYSGVVPVGVTAQNLDSMYFYTKVDIPGGGNYTYDAKLSYIDPWLGSIGGLTSGIYQLGLGKTTSTANSWVVGFTSRNDVIKRVISQTSVNFLDRFTGLVNPYAPPVLPDRDSSNRGRRFWVAYAVNQLAGGQDMVLYLSALDNANVQVKINGTTFVRNYFVAANTVTVSDIMPKAGAQNAFLNTAGLFDQGISITSDVPIVAYQHTYGSASAGASMLLPVGVWGYEYKTLGITQNYGANSFSYFYVIADNDNTKVEITPTVAVQNAGMNPGVTTTVVLNKGQVFQVIASSQTTELTGSTVKSVPNSVGKCFPIATFSGSSRTGISIPCGGGGDFIMQQNFPSTAWGKRYLTAPTSSSTGPGVFQGNLYRVAVKDPTTVVSRNGVVIPVGTLIGGQYYQFQSNTADYIIADKPIMVAQYLSGACAGVGDPEMIYISPIEQGINKVGFYRNILQSINTNHLTMIIPDNGISSLQIFDGNNPVPVVPDLIYTHPNLAGYKVVVKSWASAQNQVRVSSDSNFTGITYGLGSVESYGYNMGTLVKNLQALGSIGNTLNPTGATTEYTCAQTPFKFTMLLPVIPTSITWKFSQVPNLSPNTDVIIAAPVPTGTVFVNGTLYYKFALAQDYVFSQPGLYPVQVTYTHPTIESCDNTQTDVIYTQVIPSPEIGFNITFAGCQGNTATFNAGGLTPAGIAASSWSWTFNNATTATGQTATFTYPTAGTFIEKLKVITADGCVRDTARPVVVNPRPVVTLVADSLALCTGASATFTISSPLAGATYNWFTAATGGTPFFTGTAYTIPSITTSAVFFVEGVSSFGCVSTVRKRVVLNMLPPLTPTVVSVSVRAANAVTFSWTAVPGVSSYQVSVRGGAFITPSSGATGLTHTVTGLNILDTVTIRVQAIGVIACQTSTSSSTAGCTDSSPSVTPDSLAVCTSGNYTYLVDAPLPANVVYSWFTVPTAGTALTSGAAYTINASGSSFGVNNISPAGIYNYYAGHNNTVSGCAGTVRKKVTLNVLAPLAKTVISVDTTKITPTSITFNWSAVAGATGGYQVLVFINGAVNTLWITPSSGSNGLVHTVTGLLPNTNVTLTVRALGTLPCQTTVSDPRTSRTLTDAIYVPNAFNPNSATAENKTLKVYGYVIKDMNMMIFNQWGEKIFESSNQNVGWDGTYKGKQQPAGVYIYVLKMTLLNGNTQELKGSINLIR